MKLKIHMLHRWHLVWFSTPSRGPKKILPQHHIFSQRSRFQRRRLTIKIESFILIYDEDDCFPSLSALRMLRMGRIGDTQMH